MKKRVGMAVGAATLIVMMLAAYSVVAASADLTPAPAGAPTAWPKNANGVTYGSGLDAVSLEDEPDLIEVQATNGKIGYAYRTDLEAPDPSSPAAAVAQQKTWGTQPEVIPVYEVDGVTQIGSFEIEHSQPK